LHREGRPALIFRKAFSAPWSTPFEDPIILPDGRQLLTLKDAADYITITKLPKKESDLPEWQTAIEVLLLVSRGGQTMMARIAVMKALNRHVERVFNPERKDDASTQAVDPSMLGGCFRDSPYIRLQCAGRVRANSSNQTRRSRSQSAVP